MLYITIGKTTFKLLSSRSALKDPRIDIPEMEVTFGDGEKDTLILKHYNALPDSTNIDHTRLCNYLGYLKYEQDARVAVTGCPDQRNLEGRMYITLLSKHSLYQKSFSMDLDGHVEPIQIMQSNNAYLSTPENLTSRQEDTFTDGDAIVNSQVEAEASVAESTGVPSSIKLRIRLGTDIAAKDKLGTMVDNWLAEMFTHVQNHYHHTSLGHRINFEACV